MINANFTFDTLKAGASLISNIKKIATAIKVTTKHRVSDSVVTVEKAVEDFFECKIGPGAIVSLEGYLSKYILTHRPNFYSVYSHRVTGHKIKPVFKNPFENQITLDLAILPNQFPIQVIPPFLHEGKSVYLYFLYPPDMSSFLLKEDKDLVEKRKNGGSVDSVLEINRKIKPIIVLSPKKILLELGKTVKITGVLRETSDEYCEQFYQNMSGLQQQFLHNTIRPYAEKIGTLCLDLRESAQISIIDDKDEMPGILYVESHFENISRIPDVEKIIGRLLPGAFPGLNWSSHQNDSVAWGLSASDVFIASREYSSFAFFIESNLSHEKSYQDKLKYLQWFTENFRKKIQNYARNKHSIELKNKFDFIFDYSKAKLFHPDGVLVSKEIETVLDQNPEIKDDVKWLRNSAE